MTGDYVSGCISPTIETFVLPESVLKAMSAHDGATDADLERRTTE
jgi:hypothetical protein